MKRFTLIVVLLFVGTSTGKAQFGVEVPETVVHWDNASVRPAASAQEMTNTFGPGDTAFLTLVAHVVDDWHMYSLGSPSGRPLQIEFDALPEGISVTGSPGESATRIGHDPGLDEEYTYHEGRARIWQRLSIADNVEGGPASVSGRVIFATCREGLCLPTREVPFQASFVVEN